MNVALARIVAAAAGVLTGAAVARELDKPTAERDWHGDVGGVPYDFRAPTADSIKQKLWDPDNPRLVGPPLFGVGWSLNFARLAADLAPPSAPPHTGTPPPGATPTPPDPTAPPAPETPPPPAATATPPDTSAPAAPAPGASTPPDTSAPATPSPAAPAVDTPSVPATSPPPAFTTPDPDEPPAASTSPWSDSAPPPATPEPHLDGGIAADPDDRPRPSDN
ncbi:hypothetical protein [Actinoplanes sp. NPDC049265]|uniref:hypothetical protein n=1 Tax=Actinoplanes sp. NPDC049265 TaxID=3363902 RepID=UPI003720CADA